MPLLDALFDGLLDAVCDVVGDVIFGPIFGRFFYGIGRIVAFLLSFGSLRCVEYEDVVPRHLLRWCGLLCRAEGKTRLTMRGAGWIGCVVFLATLAGLFVILSDSGPTTG